MNILRTLFSAKKLAIFLLVALFALTLAACTTNEQVPYGSIDDSTYLTLGEYSVTEKELYNQLRTSALSRLSNFIDEKVFKDVELNASLSDFERKAFETEINTALFSNASITPKQISDMSEEAVAQRILSFADSFAITKPGIDKDALIDYLEAAVADIQERAADFDGDAADFDFGYLSVPGFNATINAIKEYYTLPVLKKVYAKTVMGDLEDGELTNELADEDSSVYISESSIVTYYKNNVAGRYNVNALIIEFASVKEQELARYKYAIKSNSRGEWYLIPNIADQDVIDAIKADNYDANSPLGKAKKILTDSIADGGLGKTLATLEKIDYRTSEFATYYSKYALNSAVDNNQYARLLSHSAEENEVLYYFLKIYDDLHSGQPLAPDYENISELEAGEPTRNSLESLFEYEYTSPLFSGNTQLRNYVYGLDKESLFYSTEDGANDEGITYGRPYSRQVQTFNNKSYLVYLMNDNREADEDILDESGDEATFNLDNPNAVTARENALRKLIDSKLTTTYISSKVTEKYEEVTVDIYDSIIRAYYKQNNGTYEGSEGFYNNDVLAMVNGEEITVDEFFADLDEVLGLSTALDIILMKKLRVEYGDQITDEDREDFREQFESQYVNPFLADQYASAGFPASMGLEQFLLLGFGAYKNDNFDSATADAIDKVYVQTKLRELFEEDLTVHFPNDSEANNIYKKFATLAETYRSNSIGISASHLLVYVDLNNDGTPDDPNKIDFAEANLLDLDGNLIVDIDGLDEVVRVFIEKINERASFSPTMAEGLNAVVQAYNNATRYELSLMTLDDLGPNPTPEQVIEFINKYNREDVWVPFKRLGLQLKFETLGEITNATNFPTSSSKFDESFFNYAMALADHLKNEIEAEGIEPNEILPLYAPTLGTSDVADAVYSIDKTRSAFGYHLILVTGYTQPSSAKLTGDETSYQSKIVNKYTNEKLSALNENDALSYEQIMIYIEESKEETGVVTLPTSVSTAITKYFDPIQQAYNNSYSQLEIAFLFIFDGEVELENQSQNAKLQALRDANLNQFFNYAYFEQAAGDNIYARATNDRYAAIYSTWFDVLNG